MRVLTAAQMRAADRCAIDVHGVPSLELMERAGAAVVAAMDAHLADRLGDPVTILCGRGNNGGDGWVVARLLRERGLDVTGLLFGRRRAVGGDACVNLDAAVRAGVPFAEVDDEDAWAQHRPRLTRSVVVDALFGTGLNRPLTGLLGVVVRDVNDAGVPVVAIDLPSGLVGDAPPGPKSGPFLRAAVTVTLAAPKLPLALAPTCAGTLVVADIGIPAGVIAALDGPRTELLEAAALRARLPRRAPDAHKGDFGRVTIVAGALGKTGAAQLAGLGALRAGAGLVTVATPAACLGVVARVPEYMTLGLPDRDGVVTGEGLDDLLAGPADVMAAGPGLGTGPGPRAVVHALLDRRVPVPLVLDADALNVCADDPDRLRGRPEAPVVITPHPGEMARLAGTTTAAIQRDRIGAARAFATERQVHVVLKGARTLIADPVGTVWINTTGNPGMATGGSGDVLTGVVAAWLAQVADVSAAVTLAVHLHGLAGDLAARSVGETALIASDIAGHLGRAVAALAGGETLR